LYRSRLRFFAGKLLSKWEGPFVIEEVYRSGAIKIASLKDDTMQVVNGQRLKHYISRDSYNEDVDVIQMVTHEEYQRTYAGICRVCFRIGNSSSQKRFALKNFVNIFVIFIKYEKSRDKNRLEMEFGGSSPPGDAVPLLAAPPCGESASELVSVPVSSCDFILMFNFRLYNPPGLPEVCISCSHRVFVSICFCQEFFLVLEAL
jgi:hypothetical protein